MAILATTTEGKKRELVPVGNHVARCVQMIHLGTKEFEYSGETKKQNKVRLVWELLDENYTYEKDGEQITSNFMIGKEYTLSMHEKSSLRKELQSWRGKPFTSDEARSFDVTKLLNVPCMLNVIHKESGDGSKTYANISSISSVPKSLKPGEATTEIIEFNFNDKYDLLETLPDWLQDRIKESDEYAEKLSAPIQENEESDDSPF